MPLPEPDARILSSWKPNLLKISLDAPIIANRLWTDGILLRPHLDIINSLPVHDDKMITLIDTYGQRAKNLEPLKRVLRETGQLDAVMDVMVPITADDTLKDVKARLQHMCENVTKAWGKLLNQTSLEKCFVEPEIVEWEKKDEDEYGKKKRKETGKVISNCEQFPLSEETFGNRIVIEGDPGMGKTTYVNKVALDWTRDEGKEHHSETSRFLQSIFSVVFLIPLRTLNGSKCSTLTQAAEIQLRGCGSWLSNKCRSCPTETLLILDAFDEYDGSCEEINDIIEGTLFPRLKVIITTRPSHIRNVTIKNQWLSITGLTTPEKRERFLINQEWDSTKDVEIMDHFMSGLSSLWHTPLYLAMLCVLYKAKKVTNFDPRHPSCFYILLKLFTEHIMSRCVNEKGFVLKKEERIELKSSVQQFAFQQFSKNNRWLGPFQLPCHISASEDMMALAGKLGLVTIEQEHSPVTGETIEVVSFIHQMFVEFYAACQLGRIFTLGACVTMMSELVENIEAKLTLTDSPFSYFLAAQCVPYKKKLTKKQKDKCKAGYFSYDFTIEIAKFPWLPEIAISDEILKEVVKMKYLTFKCDLDSIQSFWNLDYIKELCSISQPTALYIYNAFFSYHEHAIDSILSSVNLLKLENCNCEHINMAMDKVYPNLTHLEYRNYNSQERDVELLKYLPNLRTLQFTDAISNTTMKSFFHSLTNMNQLEELRLGGTSSKPQSVSHIIQFAETIENSSSLCNTLKELSLGNIILDTETEFSTEVLFKVISKCVQLSRLYLHHCQIKPQSLIIIKDILRNSDNLKNNLTALSIAPIKWKDEHVAEEQRIQTEITKEDLIIWRSEIKLILPHCYIA